MSPKSCQNPAFSDCGTDDRAEGNQFCFRYILRQGATGQKKDPQLTIGSDMLTEIYDAISILWSNWWPVTDGEITAVDVEPVRTSEEYRLAVAYKFSVGDDGPYTGESFWIPALPIGQMQKLRHARDVLRIGHPVRVRYRKDDPSVNRLDGSIRKLLQNIPS